MLSITDFENPYYGLKKQGTSTQPKNVTLIVIAWQPLNKNEPILVADPLQDLFFGAANSVAHWFQENSQGRYRLLPHSTMPVTGPFASIHDWPFYWRNDPEYVRLHLCGDRNNFCPAWHQNPFRVPPDINDPHRYVDSAGKIWYKDENNYIDGINHSYAEAIRAAAGEINFRDFDHDSDGNLSVDECLVVIVKAQDNLRGFRRSVSGSDIPKTDLKVNDVTINDICELYAGPPYNINNVVAVASEEVLHLAANLADQYPDDGSQNPVRLANDPGRPGQLSITDAGWQPVHVDPYHKLKWGWLNPQLADHSGRYTLRDAATTGDALILFSPYFGTEEFFILENRWRGTSYDRFRDNIMQEGLALWHCIQDHQLSDNWARRAIHLRRADPRLGSDGQIQYHLTLFDGNDPARGYDLTDDSIPQNLRFRNGSPSRIRIRNISSSGPVMTVDVEVPPSRGEIVSTSGRIKKIRVHDHGTGYGPPQNSLAEDCMITIDSEPGAVFGLDLSGSRGPAGQRMLVLLQDAFRMNVPVLIDYEAINATGGKILRVARVR